MAVYRGLRAFARGQPVARYLLAAGYQRIPGDKARRYISPSGQVVSRRQAEQRSGALQAIYSVRSREELTRIAPTSRAGRRTIREYASDWKRCHGDTRGINRILKDEQFRKDMAYWRNRSIRWSSRRRFMEANFCWEWETDKHSWRYHA